MVLMLGIQKLIFQLREMLFTPDQYYFWQQDAVWGNACGWISLLVAFLLLVPVFQYICSMDEIDQSFGEYWKDLFLVRYWIPALLAALVLVYLSAANVIYAGKDAIYIADTFHPTGTAVPCSEIQQIEVGYCGDKTDRGIICQGHEKGDFYYKILVNGEWITIVGMDGTVPVKEIKNLIELSYQLTRK
ncbi:MAG: hypothetical protein PUG60_14135 [Lachnospiraceae bacterium]|nr:hypothetical protein [Lachnospiraceae bacterium]